MTARETSGIPVRLTAPRAHNAVGHVRRISVLSVGVACCLAAGLVTSASAADKGGDSWQIRILPATKFTLAQAAQPKPVPAPQEPGSKPTSSTYEPAPGATSSGQLRIIPGPTHSAAPVRRPSYAEVYRSIPFSWAEYAANPSYRSQAALGLMLNQMPYPSTSQSQVPQYGYVTPYSFDNTYGTPNSANIFYGWPLGAW
ncbi:MAG TPA: hypothetical protein VEI07_13505 [Planctomycetaceae bacterium]|nr:hypothetical protein [Planctomycetaceae bacterium]